MGAAGRAVEVVAGLAGALLSWAPFGVSLLRSLAEGGGARERVAAALRTWDPPPDGAPPPRPGGGSRTVFVIAGEPSGDRLAAAVAEALRRRNPGLRVRGYGGERLRAAGASLDEDLAADAVMGVSAVLRAAPRFVGLYARYLRVLDEQRPDAVLLVDYPGLNLRAARAARRRGIPVIWYVVPQIWAWAPWRARRVARAADEILAILPFERAFYASQGETCRYVGYPVFEDRDREGVDAPLALRLREGGRPVLAILPGSRRSEVEKNLPLLAAAAVRLRGRVPGLRPVVACAAPRLRASVDGALAEAGAAADVEILDGGAPTLLSVARAAACVSGTVTMECVHAGVPAVVVYGVGPFRLAILRRLVTVPRIAMANLLAGEDVFPERVGSSADADSLATDLEPLLVEGPRRAQVVASLSALRDRLRTPGTAERVAAVVEARMGEAAGRTA